MRPQAIHVIAFCAVALLLAPSCGSSNGPGSATDSNTSNTATCQNDPQVMAYSPGMKKAGDSNIFTFVLQSANPAPPAINENTWTMQVLDGSGNPVTGATVSLLPFMPTMSHGSSITPQVSAQGSTYTITNIDLFMPGLWSMTVTASANGQTDSALFYFCING